MKDVDKLCEEDIIFIEHLYRKYSKRIYSVCGRFIHEPMDREDFVSIVLLALMSKSDKLQSLLPFEQERCVSSSVRDISTKHLEALLDDTSVTA